MPNRSIITMFLASALALTPAIALAKNDKPVGNGNPTPTPTPTPTPLPSPTPTPPVGPTVIAACELADLQGATACNGYYAGNLNGGSSGMIADAKLALAAIGYSWDGDMAKVEKIDSFVGKSIAFSLPLTGINFVSVHYGAGQGPAKVPAGTTGFYKIDGAKGLFSLQTRFGSLSNAILYLKPKVGTGGNNGGSEPTDGGGDTAGVVPEPAVWMQLILGFGLVGFARRRRTTTVAAA